MAGKSHVDVNERRLRPVYDALDNFNNKLAVQLADKVLKKQKNLMCAKALKALALVRSGRTSESILLLDEIKEGGLFDDSTLQAMTICYREMQKSEMIPSIYELAVKQNPKNEEFLSHLFMGYVRASNYVKQQQVAMNLYKAHSKNPYYFWAVMSIMMQALTSTDQKAVNGILLPLAERMVTKFIKEKKIDAEAEVQLYLMILEKAEKYEEALEVVRGDLGEKLVTLENEKSDLEIQYLKKLDRWTEVHKIYKDLLEAGPDEWSYYRGLLDATFILHEKGAASICNETGEDSQPKILVKINDVIELLERKIKDYPSFRGPRLALLACYQELLGRELRKYGDLSTKIYELMVDYYDTFSTKQCCFSDLTTVCDILSEDDKIVLISDLEKKLECNSAGTEESESGTRSTATTPISEVYKEICVECLKRRLGLHENLDNEEKLMLAKSLLKKHKAWLTLGKDLLPTDIQYADPMAILAAYLFMDVHREKGDMLWHMLLVLEESVQHSPSNHQIKLLLVHLYASIGAFSPCMKLYEEIEMKYIMLDTLGYRLTRHAQPSGSFQAANTLYSSTLKFFSGNQKDTPEQVIAAYKFGSFRKIPEIINFKDRLNNSLQFLSVTIEKLHLDVLMQVNSMADIFTAIPKMELLEKCPSSESSLKKVIDNRDFTALDCFEAHSRRLTTEEKQMSTNHEKLWVRLRSYILRCIGSACELVEENGEDKENSPQSYLKFEETLSAFTKLNSECMADDKLWHEYPVHGPTNSRIPIYCNWSHVVFQTCCECLSTVFCKKETDSKADETLKEKMDQLLPRLQGQIDCILSELTTGSGNTMMLNGTIFQKITCVVETYNWMLILFGIIQKLSKGKHGNKKGKKRKVQQIVNTPDSARVNHVPDFLNEAKKPLDQLLQELKSCKQDLVEKELNEEATSKLFEKTHSPLVTRVWENVQSSYKQSLLEIEQILELKLKLIANITKQS